MLLLSIFVYFGTASAQAPREPEAYPPNWWVGMKHTQLQVMLYGNSIAYANVKVTPKKGITLDSITKVANPNYLFLNFTIKDNTKPGNLDIFLGSQKVIFPIKERQGFENRIQGLDPSDHIYLIMPDRFANGDPDNDVVETMNQTTIDRSKPYQRHGGDLQGIIDHLDYIKSLGMTAIWLNPPIENNQTEASYHGYAATNHYGIDPRFGTMDKYRELVETCHDMGIKIVMDLVHNHVGNEHFIFKDKPGEEWFHNWDEFTRSNFRAPACFDPYASKSDYKIFKEGWFDDHMPDLNQENELVANYLIQNNIWWIEEFGTDAFRMDTYAYSDKSFLQRWNKAIKEEYPHFFSFGETWVHGKATQAYFNGHTQINNTLTPGLDALTDFQVCYAINDALNGESGWTTGLLNIYYTLAKDYILKNPYHNVTFLDNHDLGRYFSAANEDLRKYKIGVGMMLTLRGIPCTYYGTELAFANRADWEHDGAYRADFPGGWPEDSVSKFTEAGRSTLENDAFDFFTTLSMYRHENEVLQTGKLTQFIPDQNRYVYFRYNEDTTVMVIINRNETSSDFDIGRFQEFTSNFSNAKDIINESEIELSELKELGPMSIRILELTD